jgi:hypothetical protein
VDNAFDFLLFLTLAFGYSKRINKAVKLDPHLNLRCKVPCAALIMGFLQTQNGATLPSPVQKEMLDSFFYTHDRTLVLNSLVRISAQHSTHPRVYLHAVSLWDRFYQRSALLQTAQAHKTKMPLFALACLMIANKWDAQEVIICTIHPY